MIEDMMFVSFCLLSLFVGIYTMYKSEIALKQCKVSSEKRQKNIRKLATTQEEEQ